MKAESQYRYSEFGIQQTGIILAWNFRKIATSLNGYSIICDRNWP